MYLFTVFPNLYYKKDHPHSNQGLLFSCCHVLTGLLSVSKLCQRTDRIWRGKMTLHVCVWRFSEREQTIIHERVSMATVNPPFTFPSLSLCSLHNGRLSYSLVILWNFCTFLPSATETSICSPPLPTSKQVYFMANREKPSSPEQLLCFAWLPLFLIYLL